MQYSVDYPSSELGQKLALQLPLGVFGPLPHGRAHLYHWYVIFLVVLTAFTKYRYAFIWSSAIVLSYFAYSIGDFKENLWLLTIEYVAVFSFLIYELVAYRNKT